MKDYRRGNYEKSIGFTKKKVRDNNNKEGFNWASGLSLWCATK